MKFNSLQDTYTLNNGVKIPIVGFGTWQTPDGEVAEKSVLAALNAGYRHIDTAKAYGNEDSVGAVVLTVMNCLLLPSYGTQIMAMKRLRRPSIKVCLI